MKGILPRPYDINVVDINDSPSAQPIHPLVFLSRFWATP